MSAESWGSSDFALHAADVLQCDHCGAALPHDGSRTIFLWHVSDAGNCAELTLRCKGRCDPMYTGERPDRRHFACFHDAAVLVDPQQALRMITDLSVSYSLASDVLERLVRIAWAYGVLATAAQKRKARKASEWIWQWGP